MKRISDHWPVVSSAFAALLLLLVIAAEASERTDPDPEAAVQRRAIPVLPQADAQRVAELEAEIETLRRQAKYGGAILRAEAILHLRQEHLTGWRDAEGKPAEWYEIGDARRAIEDLRLLASLSREQRSELARADTATRMVTEHYAQGRYGEALRITRVQLRIRRRVLGHEHPDTLTSINNLGLLLQLQGKLAEAEPYFREALEGNRRVLGDDHPNTLITITNLIALYDAWGKPEKAAAWRGKLAEMGEEPGSE